MSACTLSHQKHLAQHAARLQSSHQDQWRSSGLTSDVFNTVPLAPANIYWGPLNAPQHVHVGNELAARVVGEPPLVASWRGDPAALFTLLMVDPDAPCRAAPVRRSMLHWMVVNIPGEDLAKGDTIAPYIGSAPPQGSGLHRYVFLIFKQTSGRVDTGGMPKFAANSCAGRPMFDVAKWLASVGGAAWPLVAGNHFSTQWDDSVPARRTGLGLDNAPYVAPPAANAAAPAAGAAAPAK